MSPSVYSTKLLMPRNQEKAIFTQPEVKKVKRALFGAVDNKATQRFIEGELSKILVTKSERWNFDFVEEKTLNPDGVYEWRPVTPKKCARSLKRRMEPEYDSTELYCDPYSDEVVCPNPAKLSSHHRTQQSHITDYMKATKRPAEVAKKSDWNTEVPPKKVSRLSEFSSSC